jgi:3',5'-cyclic AMP phosphodiesterase CpdA
MTVKSKITCHVLIAFLLVFAALSAAAAQEHAFAIVGDTRIGETESVYKAFIAEIGREKIGIVINTGDAISSPGRHEEWERLFELTGKDKNLYVAPGNHDVKDEKSLEVFEQMLHRGPHYPVSDGDTLFVFLNTEIPREAGKITGQQFEWLKDELKKGFKYKFVFLHRPPFPTVIGTMYGLDRYRPERDRLHGLFVANGVSLVVASHQHLYNRTERDGVAYVISGGGGARLHTLLSEQGGFYHYVIAKRVNEGYLLSTRDSAGNIKDEFSIK